METNENQTQPKVKGGEQMVILDNQITGETDELNPAFEAQNLDDSLGENTPAEERTAEDLRFFKRSKMP